MREVDRWPNPLMVFLALTLLACTARSAIAEGPRRAVYVTDPTSLTVDGPARRDFLALIDQKAITDVVPYGLGGLLEGRDGRRVLASWIDDLRARGARVIVPVASGRRLGALDVLFREHASTSIDGVITELEYWNATTDSRTAAFEAFTSLLGEMRARRSSWAHPSLRVGAYLGYPTPAEASAIVALVDFVFLSYAVNTPESAWSKTFATRGSLRARYAAFRQIERWPIFYARGEVVMKAAQTTRGRAVAERVFLRDSRREREGAPAGFAYFTLEAMRAE